MQGGDVPSDRLGEVPRPFDRIVWAKCHGPLKSGCGFIESLELDEAGGKSMQSVELSVEQLAGFFEMGNSGGAVPLPVFQHGQHSVSGAIPWTQLHKLIQQGHGASITRLVLNLSGPRKRGNIVWRNLKSVLKGRQGFFAVTLPDIGDALQNPQLNIVWGPL